MTVNDILELTRAGFTKEDITKLIVASSSPTQPTPEQQEAAQPAPAQAPEAGKEEKEDISKVIEEKLTEAFKPFETLYNNIAIKANMPTIGNIEPRGIDDIINDFFTK